MENLPSTREDLEPLSMGSVVELSAELAHVARLHLPSTREDLKPLSMGGIVELSAELDHVARRRLRAFARALHELRLH